jgi:hypothetical protein
LSLLRHFVLLGGHLVDGLVENVPEVIPAALCQWGPAQAGQAALYHQFNEHFKWTISRDEDGLKIVNLNIYAI